MSELSYASGTSNNSLSYETIGKAFENTVLNYKDQDALICCHQNVRLSYAALNSRVDQLAAGLLKLGLAKGDRVGIWAPNCAEWVITQLATAKLGLILVTINPAYRVAELEYAINKVGCKTLILAEQFKGSDYVAMMRELAPTMIEQTEGQRLKCSRLPSLEYAVCITETQHAGFIRFSDVEVGDDHQAFEAVAQIGKTLQAEDPINIQFTSGTTGFPKGATLTHHNILNNGFFCGERMRLTENDRLCIPVPLYHCFGMVLGVLACITRGAAMILPGEAFDAGSVLHAVTKEKCTALHGVPTMFIDELEHPDFSSFDLGSLRTGMMAGSPCPVEVMKRVVTDMHMSEVTIGYGMTEISPLSFQSLPTDSLENRVTTVGQVHPFVEAKIIDECGVVVPRGEQGEICFRGYSVMRGYWGDEALTQEVIVNNWMHSGDLAIMDDNGYVNISGRVKDMIIRGGENIYPREIEEFLFRNEYIRDVQVFGVPDEKYGEVVCAWIQLKEPGLTEDELIAFCKGQIAHFKVPQYIRFVEEFPMTVTGKIQKFIMREMMVSELASVSIHTT